MDMEMEGLLRWAYIEEMQLICCAPNAVREQEDISLQPGDFGWGILKAGAWTAHGRRLGCELIRLALW
jgi:hypothetical protein